jgi:hypothetical protein
VVEDLNWLRQRAQTEDVNEPLTALTNLAGAPMPKGIDSHAKRRPLTTR